jgi:hypothetical protein
MLFTQNNHMAYLKYLCSLFDILYRLFGIVCRLIDILCRLFDICSY